MSLKLYEFCSSRTHSECFGLLPNTGPIPGDCLCQTKHSCSIPIGGITVRMLLATLLGSFCRFMDHLRDMPSSQLWA